MFPSKRHVFIVCVINLFYMIESTQITKHHHDNQKNQQSLIDFIGQ